jgi:hypothetical protein
MRCCLTPRSFAPSMNSKTALVCMKSTCNQTGARYANCSVAVAFYCRVLLLIWVLALSWLEGCHHLLVSAVSLQSPGMSSYVALAVTLCRMSEGGAGRIASRCMAFSQPAQLMRSTTASSWRWMLSKMLIKIA